MNKIRQKIELILNEIQSVLVNNEIEDCEEFIAKIVNGQKIVTCGAGRVGHAIRGFCMRLGHMGYHAHHIGDTTVPRIDNDDVLIVASGSGETKTIVDLTTIAKNSGVTILSVTGNPNSTIAKLANLNITIKAPNKVNNTIKSQQPMTTLNEQSLGIFFDAIVLMMIDFCNFDINSLQSRHSLLE
jgi:6-phospho-3-hexuloisomerase